MHEGGNFVVNKWIALLSRAILRKKKRVISEKRVLEVNSMHDQVFDV
jgi:hypothetical protein